MDLTSITKIKHFFGKNLLILNFALSVFLITSMLFCTGTIFLGIIFSIFIFSWVLFFYIKYPDKIIGKIILLGFLLRAGLAYFQRFIGNLPDSTSDAARFERLAWETATLWINGSDAPPLIGAYYYSRVIAYIYYFFERVPLVAQFLNVVLGIAVIYFVYKTVLVLFKNKKAGHIAAFITAVFPTLNLYSAILLRETIIVFFFVFSFYLFSLWFKRGETTHLIFSLVLIFISSVFHGAFFFIGLVYLFLFCFYHPEEKRWKLSVKQLFGGLVLTIIYSFLFFGFFRTKIPNIPLIMYEKLEVVLKDSTDISKTTEITEIMDRVSSRKSRARASYLENINTNSPLDIAWQTPIRVVYFYFTPFLGNLEEIRDLAGFFDVLLWVLLFIFFLKTLKIIKKEDRALFVALLLIFVVFSVTFAWGTSNYGTAFRHRGKIAFFVILVASYSLSMINWKKYLPFVQKNKL